MPGDLDAPDHLGANKTHGIFAPKDSRTPDFRFAKKRETFPAMDQPGSTTNSRNVLGGDIEITGTVKFGNELILDGKVDGEILSDGAITIGKNAKVTGEIKTGSAVVYGTVTGNITVKDRAELKSSAQVEGDLKAARVAIEEGAIFIGKSEISSRPAKS